MAKPSTKKQVPFDMVIKALLDESKPFPPTYLHRFSDINQHDLNELRKIWLEVNPARRQALLEDLEDLAETDTLVSFDDLAIFALQDPDPLARTTAVRLLWEDQDLKLVPIFTRMMNTDPEAAVRAAAASALGLFIYLGELEEIPTEVLKELEESLLAAATGPDEPVVRRRAIEALGYSSREEVPALIQAGFESTDPDWLSSVLFAMGRSADPRWETAIMKSFDHPDVPVRVEAIRAAGQLELAAARLPLMDLLDDLEELDDEIMAAAIWSLSQIGGEGVRERLEELADATEDEDEAEYISLALDNLSFTEDFGVFEMFDFDPDSEDADELDGLISDEDEDEDGGTSRPNGNGKRSGRG